jgi:hypothetical protein
MWLLSPTFKHFVEHLPSPFSPSFRQLRGTLQIPRFNFSLDESSMVADMKQ